MSSSEGSPNRSMPSAWDGPHGAHFGLLPLSVLMGVDSERRIVLTAGHSLRLRTFRRMGLRDTENVRKRLLIHGYVYSLGFLMRLLTGIGTPRGLQVVRTFVAQCLEIRKNQPVGAHLAI